MCRLKVLMNKLYGKYNLKSSVPDDNGIAFRNCCSPCGRFQLDLPTKFLV